MRSQISESHLTPYASPLYFRSLYRFRSPCASVRGEVPLIHTLFMPILHFDICHALSATRQFSVLPRLCVSLHHYPTRTLRVDTLIRPMMSLPRQCTILNTISTTTAPTPCFEVLDGELASAASPDSPELSSVPYSECEEEGQYQQPIDGCSVAELAKEFLNKSLPKNATGEGENAKAKGSGTNEADMDIGEPVKRKRAKKSQATKAVETGKKRSLPKKKVADAGEIDSEVVRLEERPPAVNSAYIPIPFKGRLGFACLNTYLRCSNPPIFCSRTCRLDTILKHGKEGQTYVESLGLANARDLKKLILWNERYAIRFLRISSEMFPFASHKDYGYSLDFAKDTLAEAGEVAMRYGHRLTTHPGQYTQLGSPRKEVVENAVRDIEYHCQLLRFLGLKGQADKDAVMILHMGGTFGDREATIQRFRENYANLLTQEAKRRLVLENDDMCWSVHQLLPLCKELNIPLVLDWHHHNLIRDPSLREGTLDILPFMDEIKQTWTRKGITQKQHYSEPQDGAITHRDRRKHSARVKTLPPCEDTMDLMIEAKDKEQAVLELMRKFKMDGWDKFADVIPHVREDEIKPEPKRKLKPKPKKKKAKKGSKQENIEEGGNADCAVDTEEGDGVEEKVTIGSRNSLIPGEEIGMGGLEGRVFWPEGKEEWLSPAKRMRKKKEDEGEVVDVEEPELEAPKKLTRTKVKPKIEEAGLKEKESTSQRKTRKQKKAELEEAGDADINARTTEVIPKKRARKTAASKNKINSEFVSTEPEPELQLGGNEDSLHPPSEPISKKRRRKATGQVDIPYPSLPTLPPPATPKTKKARTTKKTAIPGEEDILPLRRSGRAKTALVAGSYVEVGEEILQPEYSP